MGTLERYVFIQCFVIVVAVLQAQAQSIPKITTSNFGPREAIIGNSLVFQVNFTNAGDSPGYGGFIDVVLDAHITVHTASIFTSNQDLAPITTKLVYGECVDHPLCRLADDSKCQVCHYRAAPATLYTIQLPFAAYAPDQPTTPVTVRSTLSSSVPPGKVLWMSTRAGFWLGNDRERNFDSGDPSQVEVTTPPGGDETNPQQWSTNLPLTSKLFATYMVHNRPATVGPSQLHRLHTYVDIAEFKQGENLVAKTVVPREAVITTVDGVSPPGYTVDTSADNVVTISWPSVTGTSDVTDTTSTVWFYFPKNNVTSGEELLKPEDRFSAAFPISAETTADFSYLDSRTDITNVTMYNVTMFNETHVASNVSYMQPTPVTVSFITNVSTSAGTGMPWCSLGHLKQCELVLPWCSYAVVPFWPWRCPVYVDAIRAWDWLEVIEDVNGEGVTPGDTYAQIVHFHWASAYYEVDNVFVTVNLRDGLRVSPNTYLTVTTPTQSVNVTVFDPLNATHPFNTPFFVVDESRIGNDADDATNGDQVIYLNVSAIVAATLELNDTWSGHSHIRMEFLTEIQDAFTDKLGGRMLVHGDWLGTRTTASANIVSDGVVHESAGFSQDGNGIRVVKGRLVIDLYGWNGVPCGDYCDENTLLPDWNVTMRARYSLPSTDFANLEFEIWFPYPLLDLTNLTNVVRDPQSDLPPPWYLQIGPGDTLFDISGIKPNISVALDSNKMIISYPDYNSANNTYSFAELLITVPISTIPYADGVPLSVVSISQEGQDKSTLMGDMTLFVSQPVLRLHKGFLNTTAFQPTYCSVIEPGRVCVPQTIPSHISVATPFIDGCTSQSLNPNVTILNATSGEKIVEPFTVLSSEVLHLAKPGPLPTGLIGVDAGDRVAMAFVVENIGSGGAYDLRVQEDIPVGFRLATNTTHLCAYRGDGSRLDMVVGEDGSWQFRSPFSTLYNASRGGTLERYDPFNGRNIAIIVYELEAVANLSASAETVSEGKLTNYAGVGGGPNHLVLEEPQEGVDEDEGTAHPVFGVNTTIITLDPVVRVSVVDSSVPSTPLAVKVVPGETVLFRSEVVVPEGETEFLSIRQAGDESGGVFIVKNVTFWVQSAATSDLSFNGSLLRFPMQGQLSSQNPSVFEMDPAFTLLNAFDNAETEGDKYYIDALLQVDPAAAENSAGNTISAASTVFWQGDSVKRSVSWEIVEPQLDLAVTSNITKGQSGDFGHMSLNISNTVGAVTAYNVHVDISPNTEYIVVLDVTASPASPVASWNGTHVSLTTPELGSGDSVRLDITFMLVPSVVSSTSTDLPVSLTYTSAVSLADSRNYTATAATDAIAITQPESEFFLVSTGFDWTGNDEHTSRTDLALGERMTARLQFWIPRGVTNGLTIRPYVDAASDGSNSPEMVLESVQLAAIGDHIGFSESHVVGTPFTPVDGGYGDGIPDQVTISFGTVINNASDTNIPWQTQASEAIELIAVAYPNPLHHTPGNDNGDRVRVAGRFWSDDMGSRYDSLTSDVVAPALDLSYTTVQNVLVAGQSTTVTASIVPASAFTSNGYESVLTFTPPAGTAIVPGSIQIIDTIPGLSVLEGNATSDTQVRVSVDLFNLTMTASEKVKLSWGITVSAAAQTGSTISTSAAVTFKSAPATTAPPTPAVYTRTAQLDFTVAPPYGNLSLIATSNPLTTGSVLTVGEVATVQTIIVVPRGTTTLRVNVTGSADFTAIQPLIKSIVGVNLTSTPVTFTTTLPDDELTYDFGVLTLNDDANEGYIVLDTSLRVKDTHSVSNGNSGEIRVVLDYSSQVQTDTMAVTFSEPILSFAASVNTTLALQANDAVLLSTTVTSTAGPVHGMNFSVSVPLAFEVVSASSAGPPVSLTSRDPVTGEQGISIADVAAGVDFVVEMQLRAKSQLVSSSSDQFAVNAEAGSIPCSYCPESRKYSYGPATTQTIATAVATMKTSWVSSTDTSTNDNTTLAIGESATIAIDMTIPRGTTQNFKVEAGATATGSVETLVVTDLAPWSGNPASCSYLDSLTSNTVIDATSDTLFNLTLTSDLGSIVSTSDVTCRVVTVVAARDVAGVSMNGRSGNLNTKMWHDNSGTPISRNVPISTVEPELTVSFTESTTIANPGTMFSSTVLSVRVSGASGDSTAHHVSSRFTVPPGLSWQGIGTPAPVPAPAVSYNAGTALVTLTWTAVAPGTTINVPLKFMRTSDPSSPDGLEKTSINTEWTSTSDDSVTYRRSGTSLLADQRIARVNQEPITSADDVETDEDVPAVFLVLSNDSDRDGNLDNTTLSIVHNVHNGTALALDGRIHYTPFPNWHGVTSLNYTICDALALCSAPTTVTITVKSVLDPIVSVNDVAAVPEDGTVRIRIFSNDIDIDGLRDDSSLVISTPPSNGVATFNVTAREIVYRPNAHFFGTDTLTYSVSDAIPTTDSATVTINTASINDLPQWPTTLAFTGTENDLIPTPLSLSDVDATPTGQVRVNITNPAQECNLTATLNGVTTTNQTLTLQGSTAEVDAALGTLAAKCELLFVGSVNMALSVEELYIPAADTATVHANMILTLVPIIYSPVIVKAVADGGTDSDGIYNNFDTITVYWNKPTSQPGLGSRLNVDSVFTFSQTLGLDYTGAWQNSSTAVITIVNSTTSPSAPPSPGALSVARNGAVKLAGNPFSVDRPIEQVKVEGDWGLLAGPTVISLTASGAGGSSTDYDEGDTITVVFSESIWAPLGREPMVKAYIDGLLTFTNPLGRAYTGAWASDTTLVITIVNTTGADPAPAIGSTRATGNLDNAKRTNRRTSYVSPTITGNWGLPAGPAVEKVVVAGDNVTIYFTQSVKPFDISSKSAIDQAFAFSNPIGLDYTGQWLNSSILEVHIVDVNSSLPTYVTGQPMTWQVKPNVLLGGSASTRPSTPAIPITAWDTRAAPGVGRMVASDPETRDAVYGGGDVINLYFTKATNQPELTTRKDVDAIFTFNTDLSLMNRLDYTGTWLSAEHARITIVGVSGVTRVLKAPSLNLRLAQLSENITIPAIGKLNISKISPLLRQQGSVGMFSAGEPNPPAGGTWGDLSGPRITRVFGYDPVGISPGYGISDVIEVSFDHSTSQPSLGDKEATDRVFKFSQDLGADYSSVWTNSSTVRITILDATGASPPQVGIFTVSCHQQVLYNNMLNSLPTDTSQSPPLEGSWGFGPGNLIGSEGRDLLTNECTTFWCKYLYLFIAACITTILGIFFLLTYCLRKRQKRVVADDDLKKGQTPVPVTEKRSQVMFESPVQVKHITPQSSFSSMAMSPTPDLEAHIPKPAKPVAAKPARLPAPPKPRTLLRAESTERDSMVLPALQKKGQMPSLAQVRQKLAKQKTAAKPIPPPGASPLPQPKASAQMAMSKRKMGNLPSLMKTRKLPKFAQAPPSKAQETAPPMPEQSKTQHNVPPPPRTITNTQDSATRVKPDIPPIPPVSLLGSAPRPPAPRAPADNNPEYARVFANVRSIQHKASLPPPPKVLPTPALPIVKAPSTSTPTGQPLPPPPPRPQGAAPALPGGPPPTKLPSGPPPSLPSGPAKTVPLPPGPPPALPGGAPPPPPPRSREPQMPSMSKDLQLAEMRENEMTQSRTRISVKDLIELLESASPGSSRGEAVSPPTKRVMRSRSNLSAGLSSSVSSPMLLNVRGNPGVSSPPGSNALRRRTPSMRMIAASPALARALSNLSEMSGSPITPRVLPTAPRDFTPQSPPQ